MFEAAPHPLRVATEGGFRVARAATSPAKELLESRDWKKDLEEQKERIGRWQHKLYADGRYSMLVIFQSLDAGGKDSTIRHVFTGANPTGLRVTSFKRPSETELSHDFLWRTTAKLPETGHIGIFNRSYYEEVLVVRVHPELLRAQHLPDPDSPTIWQNRYRAIAEHERHLAESGIVVLKFWLNVSKKEQRRRLLARIDRPNKRWKFDPADLGERAHWDAYMRAYEDCVNATSRAWAPWYVVPADDKPYTRWQVAKLVNEAFERIAPDFPSLDRAGAEELEKCRKVLERD
ncbi:MAG TPA: PPK2 family polyphosphate kinase [Gammaproteobacteria bacterium]|nr:PPK2 family polyphosphate kinase [Gammaproteobacteria bacterium]